MSMPSPPPPRYHTHLMLVSDQAAANLLPALDPALKPQLAVLLVSQRMGARADALAAALQDSGVKVSRELLPNEHDYQALQHTLLELAPRLATPASSASAAHQGIAINLTGGNKLMALAALEVARAADWATFYVDVDTDQVSWIESGTARHAPHTLTQHLRLNIYLRGYGYTLLQGAQRPQLRSGWRELFDELILNLGSLESGIGQVNYLAQQAADSQNLRVKLSDAQRDSVSLQLVLDKFKETGLLEHDYKQLSFADEQARKIVNGGWLEYHVWQQLCLLHKELGLRDSACNLQVTGPTGQPNEIDVAFMARNRLHMIECKTARMDDPLHPRANDALYKLAENRSRIGGLGCRAMLCSYRRLRESEVRLAQALQIKVCAGPDLARLPEQLKQWVHK